MGILNASHAGFITIPAGAGYCITVFPMRNDERLSHQATMSTAAKMSRQIEISFRTLRYQSIFIALLRAHEVTIHRCHAADILPTVTNGGTAVLNAAAKCRPFRSISRL